MSDDEILQTWDNKRTTAATSGTWMHAMFEPMLNRYRIDAGPMHRELDAVIRFLCDLHSMEVCIAEPWTSESRGCPSLSSSRAAPRWHVPPGTSSGHRWSTARGLRGMTQRRRSRPSLKKPPQQDAQSKADPKAEPKAPQTGDQPQNAQPKAEPKAPHTGTGDQRQDAQPNPVSWQLLGLRKAWKTLLTAL